jgi:hypothetical protein
VLSRHGNDLDCFLPSSFLCLRLIDVEVEGFIGVQGVNIREFLFTGFGGEVMVGVWCGYDRQISPQLGFNFLVKVVAVVALERYDGVMYEEGEANA